jgi:hypothetical protein
MLYLEGVDALPTGRMATGKPFQRVLMAKVRTMYWKEVPVQVQAMDDSGPISRQLDDRFQQGVDSISMFDGSGGTDAYLEAWEWGDYAEVQGSAEEAVTAMADRLNNGFPRDFVARVRKLHDTGGRDPLPGAVDHWTE